VHTLKFCLDAYKDLFFSKQNGVVVNNQKIFKDSELNCLICVGFPFQNQWEYRPKFSSVSWKVHSQFLLCRAVSSCFFFACGKKQSLTWQVHTS